MILNRFNPLITLFDAFERFWEASYSQRRLAGIFFWVYLLALALIQARRAGLMPAALAAIEPFCRHSAGLHSHPGGRGARAHHEHPELFLAFRGQAV